MTKNSGPFALIVLLLLGSLTGCETALSDTKDLGQVSYPTVVVYDQATQKAAAGEITAGSCPVMSDMLVDYGQVRDEIRVLLGQKVDVKR